VSTEPTNNPAALELSPDEQNLEKGFKKLVWLALIIIAAVAVWGLISHNQRVAAEEAAEAFTTAKTIEDCDNVIQKHAGTAAAGNALLLKATLHWDKNEKTSSIEALQKFVSQHASHPAYGQTLLSIATKQEAMGDKTAAKASFERVISELGGSDLAQLAQIRLGDMLWADGKADEARKAYEAATKDFPGIAAFEDLSKTRLEWLDAGLPTKEVDPPPAPKPVEAPKTPSISSGVPGLPEMKLSSSITPPSNSAVIEGSKPSLPTLPAASVPPPAAPKSATSPPVEVPATKPAAPAAPAAPAPPPPAAPKP
jgi:predicted negative regulator of RcsB-dependent stress response